MTVPELVKELRRIRIGPPIKVYDDLGVIMEKLNTEGIRPKPGPTLVEPADHDC